MKVLDAVQMMLTPLGSRGAVEASHGVIAALQKELLEKDVAGFAIDSRAVKRDEIFFAFAPEDYARHGFNYVADFRDAHEFIPDAFARGALLAVARSERFAQYENLAPLRERIVLVDDVIAALQQIAHQALLNWNRPVVAVTGSAGKTTTKELTAHVLRANGYRALKTYKNYNTEIGLPLSILQMESAGAKPQDFDAAVLEMGMSSPFEIRNMCRVAPPDVSIVTVVAPVHVEFMGSVENIARAKAQIVEGLKPTGTAILNADDERVRAMRSIHQGDALMFGIENAADVTASEIDTTTLGRSRFTLRTPRGAARAELPLAGRPNLMNALAAAAAATVFGIESEAIAHALSTSAPTAMRGEVLHFDAGFTVVDDTYNSNPRSLLEMTRAVAATKNERTANGAASRVIVVAGEMLELGAESEAMHRETGREIARAGVDILFGVRGVAREIIEGARAAGMDETRAKFFETTTEAAESLAAELQANDVALVKGSRGVRMETIIKFLRERYEGRKENAERRTQNAE